jgi:hypothetical protein
MLHLNAISLIKNKISSTLTTTTTKMSVPSINQWKRDSLRDKEEVAKRETICHCHLWVPEAAHIC